MFPQTQPLTKEYTEYAPEEAFNQCKLSPAFKAMVDEDVKRLNTKFDYVFHLLEQAKSLKGMFSKLTRPMIPMYEFETKKAHHQLSWVKLTAYQKTDEEFLKANPPWEMAVQSYDSALDFTQGIFDFAKNLEGQ